jgi:hypothetical protein
VDDSTRINSWHDDLVKMRCPNRSPIDLRAKLRLTCAAVKLRSSLHFACVCVPSRCTVVDLTLNTHRYEEHIAGRKYLIEVSPVSQTRWRAQIARLPGMPTAMMPFYGHTPEAAADELRQWLVLVYKGTGLEQ